MATRMQQRRGTAAQWTSANPILAAGEIGFETDTGQFKIGNGSSAWSALSYFKDTTDGASSFAPLVNGLIPISYMANLIDGASANLDTLKELENFANSIDGAIDTHSSTVLNVHGIADTSELATNAGVSTAATAAQQAAEQTAATALSNHASNEVNVHGIADTSLLATISYAEEKANDALSSAEDYVDNAITSEVSNRNTAISSAITDHNSDTSGVHGITDTAALATKTYADGKASDAQTAAQTFATGQVSTHNSGTTNVHGISDTAALATKTYADGAVSTAVAALTKSSVGLGNVDNTSDANKPISTATQTALDLKAPLANPTFTGTVAGITASMVGLGNVDNTSDANKPVSTAQAAAIATAKSEAIADATSQVNAVIASAPAALNTLDELAAALGDDANFATTVTNSLAAKAPLASPTFTGTVTLPAAGIVFSDGTQSKEGVPSRTSIIQKSAAYTLSALSERDSMIEVSHTGGTAVDITIPANSSVAYPVGTSIDILRTNTGKVRIVGAAGVTVNATPGAFLRDQWSAATLFKRATDTWVLIGDLATA